MPKRIRKPDRDLSEVDADILSAVTAFETGKSIISQVMAEMGRKGGKVGGKRRLETMSEEQRSRSAKKAAKARWAKENR